MDSSPIFSPGGLLEDEPAEGLKLGGLSDEGARLLLSGGLRPAHLLHSYPELGEDGSPRPELGARVPPKEEAVPEEVLVGKVLVPR